MIVTKARLIGASGYNGGSGTMGQGLGESYSLGLKHEYISILIRDRPTYQRTNIPKVFYRSKDYI